MTNNNNPSTNKNCCSTPDTRVYAVINRESRIPAPLVIAHVGPDEAIAATKQEAHELREMIAEDIGDVSHLHVARLDITFE